MTHQNDLGSKVGAVLSKRGKVTAAREGEVRILKRGDVIFGDDVVYTVRGANLQLKMNDNNIIMLRGGSAFRVSLYHLENDHHEAKRFEYSGGALKVSQRRFSSDKPPSFHFSANANN